MKRTFGILILLSAFTSIRGYSQSLYPLFEWTSPSDTLVYQKAMSFLEQQNYDDCIKTLQKLPKPVSEQPATYWLFGTCLSGKEMFVEAVDAFSQAINLDSTAVGLYYDRAYAYMQVEKFHEAVADLRVVTRYLPGNHQIVLNLAYCLFASDQIDQAIVELETLPDRDTTVADALGWYYIENGDYGKAIFLLEPLLQEYPSFAPGYETLSLAFSAMGYTPEAIQAADVLIELQPGYGRAYFLKGVYLEEADREEDAEANFRVARKLGYEWDDY